jgi:hypothetical protein
MGSNLLKINASGVNIVRLTYRQHIIWMCHKDNILYLCRSGNKAEGVYLLFFYLIPQAKPFASASDFYSPAFMAENLGCMSCIQLYGAAESVSPSMQSMANLHDGSIANICAKHGKYRG